MFLCKIRKQESGTSFSRFKRQSWTATFIKLSQSHLLTFKCSLLRSMTFFKVNDHNFRFSQKGNYMVTSLEVDRKGVFILRKNVAIQNEMTATATLG